MGTHASEAQFEGTVVRRKSITFLFVGSGCAALIYEVVWFQLLRLVIGGSWISLGILLATFMGGMCVGSLVLPILVPERHHPLRVYAALELAIGAFGATLPWWLPAISHWYVSVADHSLTGISARAVVATLALLPATLLMGATLPAVARWVKSTPAGLAQLGTFYGANIFGAVAGCLLAGFVLLPQTNMVYTSNVAAAINVLVAVMALALAKRSPYRSPSGQARPATQRSNAPLVVCIVIALSGFAALAAEVVWTRLLALLFGATVYTFSIILAVFLVGLGIGSALAARATARTARPLFWLALAQLAIVLTIPYANFMITHVVPFWLRPVIDSIDSVYLLFLHDMLRTSIAVLPAAILWGASFPLALAAAARGTGDSGRLVGQVYAANTLGAVVGSLTASAWLISWVGSQRTQQFILIVSGIAAASAVFGMSTLDRAAKPIGAGRTAAPGRALWLVPLVLTMVGVWLVLPIPRGMLAQPLQPFIWDDPYIDLFEREGRSSQVVVQENPDTGYRSVSISGKVCATNIPKDLRCQRLLGHLPALIHGNPKKTLTVGLGAGTTAGCFVLYPQMEQIRICEIEPVVREAARIGFSKDNHDVVDDSRTLITFDDARHFLATTDEQFDVITSDPLDPWFRGAAALYTTDYYNLCREHLSPGGVMVQWIPLYEADLDTVKCELASFMAVFPHATLWTSWRPGDDNDEGHDIIAVGQVEPTKIDLLELERRIDANPQLRQALAEVNLGTVVEILGQYAGHGVDLLPWLADAQVNTDSSLRLEYLAGLSLWVNRADVLFYQMKEYRRYPAGMLENDNDFREEILNRLDLPPPPLSGGAD